MKVAMHELKSGLSRYVAMARAGEVIEITSHDKPVARLVGVPPDIPSGISRLLACGAATWKGGKPAFQAPLALSPGGKSLSEMVLEDRG